MNDKTKDPGNTRDNITEIRPKKARAPAQKHGTGGTRETTEIWQKLVNHSVRAQDINHRYPIEKPTDYVPTSYVLTEEGVFKRSLDDHFAMDMSPICGPLLVYGGYKALRGFGDGMLVRALTQYNEVIELAVPSVRLHGDPAELARMLADRGVRIVPGQERKLLQYLDTCRQLIRRRPPFLSLTKLGWWDLAMDYRFLFIEGTHGRDGNGEIALYAPPQPTPYLTDQLGRAGTVDEWGVAVAAVAAYDPLCTFAIFGAFASLLLGPGGYSPFGLHFYGLTSRGKTTLLQVMASVVGRGTDPDQDDNRSFIQKWNSTANALELLMEEHNDLPLALDELGTFANLQDMGKVIYGLASARGRRRMKANGESAPTREGRSIVFSTGEASIREFMQQAGKTQKGGQSVRFMDIPMPAGGLFEGELDAGHRIRHLKQVCGEFYGSAARAFVHELAKRFKPGTLKEELRRRVSSAAEALAKGQPPEIARAAEHFGLIQAAGELAFELNILSAMPINMIQIAENVRYVWNLWRNDLPVIDDGKRSLAAIANFIKTNQGRFASANSTDPNLIEVYGYRKDDLYLFTSESLRKALGDISEKVALDTLKLHKLLFRNDPGRLLSKHSITCLGPGRTSFYAITSAILEFDAEPIMPDETEEEDEAVPNVPATSEEHPEKIF